MIIRKTNETEYVALHLPIYSILTTYETNN